MAEYRIPARQVIFREGDPVDAAYAIREGSVEILTHGEHGEIKLAELQAGEVFGEMGLFDAMTNRSATARTVTETVVDVITGEDFREMIADCPPRILPIFFSLLSKLRAANLRVKEKEQTVVLLETDISSIIISPAAELPHGNFAPVELPVAHLPLRIGGYQAHGDRSKSAGNHVNIASDGPPLMVSASHCEIMIENGQIYVRDMASRFGTIVNHTSIGRGRGTYKAPLQNGENTLILGDKKLSPYHITVSCM